MIDTPRCSRPRTDGAPCRTVRAKRPNWFHRMVDLAAATERYEPSDDEFYPACRQHMSPAELVAQQDERDEDKRDWAEYRDGRYPACWSWPVPAIQDAETRYDTFHAGRCAVCGRTAQLVEDHDHESGLHRGPLCRSCNTTEGLSAYPIFMRYRLYPPALMVGYVAEYESPFDRWS